MVSPADIYAFLKEKDVTRYVGVPDSLLKYFCAYVAEHAEEHIIAANEGNAVGIAAGQYFATGQPSVVYLQNSGLGNTINPLLSMADPSVFGIPMLLFVGWRGEPGLPDAVQHQKQGNVTESLMKGCDLDYEILPEDLDAAKECIGRALKTCINEKSPFVLLIRKGTFESFQSTSFASSHTMSREEALGAVLDALPEDACVVATTGKLSRELSELREKRGDGCGQDFLMVGSMGHCSSIALGIATSQPKRSVYCLDGDGALLMHAGSLPVIASERPKNFHHIIFNNEVHDSVGGQPTPVGTLDVPALALACGYAQAKSIKTKEDIPRTMKSFARRDGPSMLEIRIRPGARGNLTRPAFTPIQNKELFMTFLKS